MTEALLAQGVSVSRGGRAVVSGLSFSAHHGSVTAIIGPNGAGKSSLLRALLGLLPYAGSVCIEGHEVARLTPGERAQRVAYVPQHSLLAANVRVRDVVAQGRFAHKQGLARALSLRVRGLTPTTGTHDSRCVERALHGAQISSLAERAYNQLSGGEQRRVLLARALATEARVLLLDEPTAGLDVAQVLRFHELTRALAGRGLSVVYVLHDLLDVYRHADQAVLLSRGRLAASGPARDVIRSRAVETVYGVRMNEPPSTPFALLEQTP